MDSTIRSYKTGLADACQRETDAAKALVREPSDAYGKRRLESARSDARAFKAKLVHAVSDRERIVTA